MVLTLVTWQKKNPLAFPWFCLWRSWKHSSLSHCNIYGEENAHDAAHGTVANVPSAAARGLHASAMKHICITADGDQNKCIIYGSSQPRKWKESLKRSGAVAFFKRLGVRLANRTADRKHVCGTYRETASVLKYNSRTLLNSFKCDHLYIHINMWNCQQHFIRERTIPSVTLAHCG